jgi:hypothetical protein
MMFIPLVPAKIQSTWLRAAHSFLTSDAEKTIKIPDEATHQQIYDVVINFITQHPEKRHQTSVALIVRALHDAWPAK